MNTRRGFTGILWWGVAVTMAALLAVSTVNLQAQRDPGFNQPGAIGNRGRDPGLNQPGAIGNVGVGGSARQTRLGDPGFNQPGAAGNRGRDPGFNQPGAAGNRGRRR